MGRVDLAIRVTEEGSKKALFSCRDDSWWFQPEWTKDEAQPCPEFTSETTFMEAMLDPKPYALIYPSGLDDMEPPPPALSSHPEAEPNFRELSGWQKEQMQQRLEKFPGNKIIVLVTKEESRHYAEGLRDVFSQSHWMVKGPILQRRTDCILTDVEVLTWKDDFGNARPQVRAVDDAFNAGGIKGGRHHLCVLSSPKALVLWVGVKSPDEMKDDMPSCPLRSAAEVDKLVSQF